MAKLIGEKKIKQRTAQIKKWIREGIPKYKIPDLAREKFGSGPNYNTICAIALELDEPKPKPKPKPPTEETALVLSSPTGLVPAKEITPRLRALISHVADAMIEEGILAVTIDGREVMITHHPEETVFEV